MTTRDLANHRMDIPLTTPELSRPEGRRHDSRLARRPPSLPYEHHPQTTGLPIRVSAGVGEGATRLAAFDAALRAAGVGDFNLVRLSSVIPPQSVVTEVEAGEQLSGGHGDLLYCVYADVYASTPGQRLWAGLAWSRRTEQPGGGLFVEHTGASRTQVERDLGLSLEDLSRGRGGGFTEAGRRLVMAECLARPVCALVVASYRNSDWNVDGR